MAKKEKKPVAPAPEPKPKAPDKLPAAPINFNREEFLQKLESVLPGLSPREIIEQSDCFVFQDGLVFTYNDEVACSTPFHPEVTGAVKSSSLLALLRKLLEETLVLTVDPEQFLLEGKKRKAGCRRQAEVLLPVSNVERPGKWLPLAEDFLDAIKLVHSCASKDESKFALTCIHLHPKWVEACNNWQITRYRLATGVAQPTLVRKNSIKHIISMGMTQFCETPNWIHFRNPGNIVLSCRRYLDPYPSLKEHLAFTGEKIVMPKGLGNAAELAAIFSGENKDDNFVKVKLKPGRITLRGDGVTGWYQENKKVSYDGPELEFKVAPEQLVELTAKHTDAEITEGKLRVTNGPWVFVTALASANAGTPPPEETETEETPAE